MLDSILSWFERIQRTPWGSSMLAAAGTLGLALAQLIAGLHWVLIISLAIPIFASFVYLTINVPIWLNKIRPFPFLVSVPALGEADDNVQAQVLILNRQSGRRMALVLELYCKKHWYQLDQLEGLKTDLATDELTEGVVRFGVDAKPVDERTGHWYLRVSDMVSRRRTELFNIPGCYPRNMWLKTNKKPGFTKTSDQVLKYTWDLGSQLTKWH